MAPDRSRSPLGAGIWLGVGLGALVDGILLHQMLQWHQMLSGWVPNDTLAGIRTNTVADGLFHALAWTVTVVGIDRLWRAGRGGVAPLRGRRLVGSALVGWGGFNIVEGLIDHAILGVHRVNERVPPDERLVWDLAFLAFGALLIAAGALLVRASARRAAAEAPA